MAEEIDIIPPNALLAIDGVKFHPLSKPIITIGRRLENDLVIIYPDNMMSPGGVTLTFHQDNNAPTIIPDCS